MSSDDPMQASSKWQTVDFRPAPAGTRIVYFGYDTDETGKPTYWTHVRPCPGWLIQDKKRLDTEPGIQDESVPPRRVVVADYNWHMHLSNELVDAYVWSHYTEISRGLVSIFWKVLAPGEALPSEDEAADHLRRSISLNGG